MSKGLKSGEDGMTMHSHPIGQLFIVGYPGAEPPEDFLHFVESEQLGGVILFADNCPSYARAAESIGMIKMRYRKSTPIIAIDQEGGRVTRLKGAPAEFRAPFSYAEQDQLETYVEDYTRAAVCMESLGFNCNLAPVADLFLDEENSCLVDRCFGRDASTAIPFIRKTIEISHSRGLLACAKHFPGLGAAAIDPHKATAVADYTFETWKARERAPFKAASDAAVDMIMTTHLRVPQIDSVIATGSPTIISDMLRLYLGFDGPVVTDDLTMLGAEALGDIGERTIRAFQAGHDILLFGQDYQAARKALYQFRKAIDSARISPERVTSALERIASVKCRLARPAIF